MGVNVGCVDAAFWQDVDPDVFQHQFTVTQVKTQVLRKFSYVFIERVHHILEDWKAPRQIRKGRIAGVACIAVLLAPLLASLIIFCDDIAGLLQLGWVNFAVL